MICGFQNCFRDLAQAGAEAIAVPAAFVKKTGQAHWHVLNRARAIENGCFIIAPCAVGPIPGGGESYGHSLIIDPWGQVLADGGEDQGFIQATIDLSQARRVRSKIPSLTHDRAYSLQSDRNDRKIPGSMSSVASLLGDSYANHPLKDRFLKWQCHCRQMMMRDNMGRPDATIMP
jgi:hypothetical protein